jgi:HEAT repeat protein
VWRWLLDGLARGWGPAAAPHRPLPPERRERVDAAVVQLFTGEPTAPCALIQEQVLSEALTAGDIPLGHAAATILGLRGDARGLHLLLAAARDGDAAAQLRAVEALGRLKDERAGPALIDVLAGTHDDKVHHAAARALAVLHTHALPALTEALHHAERHVRWHACRLLGDLGDARAAGALAEALDDHAYNIRWAAAEALAGLGAAAIPALLARVARYVTQDDTYHAAHYALHRLAIGPWRARLAPLLDALKGPAASAKAPGVAQELLESYGEAA